MSERKGFSLLELLMVLSLLTLLASVALPVLSSWQARIEVDRANSALINSTSDAKLRAVREGIAWTIRTSKSPECLEVLPALEPNKRDTNKRATSSRLEMDRFPLPKSIAFQFYQLETNEQLDFLTVSSNGNLIPARIWLLQDGKPVLSYECERLTGSLRRSR